jgi:DNA mismatch endonuclease, patch repair protein
MARRSGSPAGGETNPGPAQGRRQRASLRARSIRSARVGRRRGLSKSEQMARVRSRDTLPEKVVRSALAGAKVRFRLHRRDLPGTPDLYIGRLRLAIFVHGCFWHGHDCPRGTPPSTNTEFWTLKLRRNVERDDAARSALRDCGIATLTIWACQLASIERTVAPVVEAYHRGTAQAPVNTP